MKINAQVLEGNWNQIKGKLREKWGEVSQDDLQQVKGNVDQLVGLIQKKTGEARDKVEKYLSELTAEGGSGISRALNAAREYAGTAVDSIDDMTSQATDIARGGYESAGRIIQQRPLESLAVGFGAGLVAGVIVGLLMRTK